MTIVSNSWHPGEALGDQWATSGPLLGQSPFFHDFLSILGASLEATFGIDFLLSHKKVVHEGVYCRLSGHALSEAILWSLCCRCKPVKMQFRA